MPALPDVTQLSHAEKDTFILALWQRLEEAERRIAELEAKARRAAEDTEQFEPAAIEGREAQSGGEEEAQRPAPG